MKNTNTYKLSKVIYLAVLASLIPLSGCSQILQIIREENCKNHVDSDFDSLCDNCGKDLQITYQEFSGITFNNKTFEEDGNNHSIFCSNVPSYATVTYEGNEQKEVGTYNVKATITAENYRTLVLYADMTITAAKLNFENLIFNSLTVEYDGDAHTILVENLPSFASVNYTNNSKTGVGSYNATAVVSAEGYNTKTLTATLTITAKQFSGITFKDKTFRYDGYSHSIYVEGAPSFATVTYSNNGKSSIGSYTVTATVKATGYKTLTLTAVMKIAKMFEEIVIPNRTLIYDGSAQRIQVELPSSLPYYTQVSYAVDGKACVKDDFRVKTIGTHTVSITLTNEDYGYEPATFSAQVTVISQTDIITTNSSKTPYKITDNVKYKDLRNELLKGNFTVKAETLHDYFYPDSSTKSEKSATTIYCVDGNKALAYCSYEDKSSTSSYLSETSLTSVEVVNNEVLVAQFEEGVITTYDTCKFDVSYYEENIVANYGLQAIRLLKEANNGGFENSQQGGYVTEYGAFSIDTSNNTFTMETRNHYYHTEFNHDEVCVYTISNIGNTLIKTIDAFDVKKQDYSLYEYGTVVCDGISYRNGKANISFDALDITYVERKAHILLPKVNGVTTSELTYEYYDKYYDLDLTGYEIDVYFDKNGYYQGEYSDLGYVKYNNYLKRHFADYGGTIKYYGEW